MAAGTSLRLAAWLLAGLLAGGGALATPGDGGPAWSSLSAPQREVLAPLAKDWDSLDADRKRKWLEISQRFPSMAPARQERVKQRMVEWARLSPEQRTEARNNFQESKKLPAEERQAQWEAYRALPPEQRKALAERSRPPAEAAARPRGLRDAPLDAQAPKSNIVGDTPAPAAAPRPVSPSVIKGNPGATTSLMSKPPAAPAHQQAGMPKISANPDMVDRSTLLPKRGPQGAAVRPAPASSGTKR